MNSILINPKIHPCPPAMDCTGVEKTPCNVSALKNSASTIAPFNAAQAKIDSTSRMPSFELSRNMLTARISKPMPDGVFTSEELKDIILQAVSSFNLRGSGGEALVFNVRKHPQYVLRITNKAFEELDSGARLPDNLKVIPVKYTDNILMNQNLGLPLYVVADADNKIKSSKSFISPGEASGSKILLLKNMTGKPPSNAYIDALGEFTGFFDSRQMKDFFALKCASNKQEFMQKCKSGDNFLVSSPEKFYDNYVRFKDKYLKNLKAIADFPKEAYNRAITLVTDDNDVFFDFSHPNNILVDFNKKEFNFVYLSFKNTFSCFSGTEKLFTNALFGDFCLKNIKPSNLLIFPEEKEMFKKLATLIAKKCKC